MPVNRSWWRGSDEDSIAKIGCETKSVAVRKRGKGQNFERETEAAGDRID